MLLVHSRPFFFGTFSALWGIFSAGGTLEVRWNEIASVDHSAEMVVRSRGRDTLERKSFSGVER